jgi:hypothetical protein
MLGKVTKERDDLLRAWRRGADDRAEFDAIGGAQDKLTTERDRVRHLEQEVMTERDRVRHLERELRAEQSKVAHLVEELRSLQLDREWARLLSRDRIAPPTELRRRVRREAEATTDASDA